MIFQEASFIGMKKGRAESKKELRFACDDCRLELP